MGIAELVQLAVVLDCALVVAAFVGIPAQILGVVAMDGRRAARGFSSSSSSLGCVPIARAEILAVRSASAALAAPFRLR